MEGYPPQASGLKKCAIILLIIHLVLIFLFIVDHIRIVNNDEAKYIYVKILAKHYEMKNDKEPTADQKSYYELSFSTQHIGSVIYYIIAAVINGLVLKGVLGGNRGLIMFGAIMSILGCLSACCSVYYVYDQWQLEFEFWKIGFGPAIVVRYILLMIIDVVEIVVLFKSYSSIGGAGMAYPNGGNGYGTPYGTPNIRAVVNTNGTGEMVEMKSGGMA